MAPARIDIALNAALAVGDSVFDDVFRVHGHRRARVLGDKENVVATLDALPFVVVADEDWQVFFAWGHWHPIWVIDDEGGGIATFTRERFASGIAGDQMFCWLGYNRRQDETCVLKHAWILPRTSCVV